MLNYVYIVLTNTNNGNNEFIDDVKNLTASDFDLTPYLKTRFGPFLNILYCLIFFGDH